MAELFYLVAMAVYSMYQKGFCIVFPKVLGRAMSKLLYCVIWCIDFCFYFNTINEEPTNSNVSANVEPLISENEI